MSRYKIR